MERVVRAAALAVSAWVLLPSCKQQAATSATDGAASAAAPTSGDLTPEQSAEVLARVGDRTITLGDFVEALRHMDQFDRLRYQAPERRKELLGEMIDVMLLADEARAQGYDKDPLAEQEIREVLRDAYLKKATEGAPAPADIPADDVRAYYDAHKADFHDPERRRASAVVVATAASAAEVLFLAKKGNASQWGDLVRSRSTEPGAKANVPIDLAGDLGFTSPPGDDRGTNAHIPEPVRVGLFDIASVGDVLDRVVPAGGRFYVVRFTSKADAHDRTFADAERSIRVKLAQDKLRAREDEVIDGLRKQYPVQIDQAALATVNVDAPSDGGVAH